MLDKEFLFSRQHRSILLESDIVKTNIKIISNYFRAFDNNYIFASLYKDMYVTKICVLFNVFYCRNDNDNLFVIIRVEEFYFCDVLFVRVDAFRNSFKI